MTLCSYNYVINLCNKTFTPQLKKFTGETFVHRKSEVCDFQFNCLPNMLLFNPQTVQNVSAIE